jgi:transposase
LRTVAVDDVTVALRLLVDRRDGLGHARTDLLNRIHKLLLELLPGGAKPFLSADQARALLNTIRPRDLVGRTRRRLTSELISELVGLDRKIKAANKELTELVASTGSSLQDLNGIGPSGAARLIGDVGDIHRFASRGHFASCNGTAPLDASSGDQQRHRLSRRQPAQQPGTAHHGRRAATLRHRRPRLPPAPSRHRQYRHGSDSAIQRGRPDPHDRHFGSVTSRTRQNPP